jgi:Uncharacterized alpha/beta hydrolase domain (DUF2235)
METSPKYLQCFEDRKTPLPGQDIRQVWFSGFHSDVGGSYSEREAGLSKVSFEWILVEAQKAQLKIDVARANIVLGRDPIPPNLEFLPRYVTPDAKGVLHESLKGAWWLLEYYPRSDPRTHGVTWYFPRGRWYRQIPEGSFIHQSVLDGGYAVSQLPKSRVRRNTRIPYNTGDGPHKRPEWRIVSNEYSTKSARGTCGRPRCRAGGIESVDRPRRPVCA